MDALQDEVESLEAILMDDVIIKRNPQTGVPELIETTIFPVVGEDAEQQYVCVTLQVLPPPGYPDVCPDFKLLRPRGLDDARLEAIKAACLAKIQSSIGDPIVFDLMEVVREHLTFSNLPSGQCVICLYGFCDGDEFTRTECFHYLHSYCLSRHLNALRRSYNEELDKMPNWLQKTATPFQALCPVCREPIKDDYDSLKCAMPPSELQNAPDFKITDELRELQERMAKLFIEQKNRGAIIDVEAETATVISIETEEEMRQRLQQKQEEMEAAAAAAAANKFGANEFRYYGENSSGSSSPETTTTTTPTAANDTKDTKAAAASSTSFAPVVDTTAQTRSCAEPTNNNYQHYRRHRGGRREHHRHHRHRHDRERERDRDRGDERNEETKATSAGGATVGAAQLPTHSVAAATTHNHGNKQQPKGHYNSHSHAR